MYRATKHILRDPGFDVTQEAGDGNTAIFKQGDNQQRACIDENGSNQNYKSCTDVTFTSITKIIPSKAKI